MKNNFEIKDSITVIWIPFKGLLLQCLIDTADLEVVNQFNTTWFGRYQKTTDSFIALTKVGKLNPRHYFMHRLIMSAPAGMDVDHIHHDTLDNRKAELRVVSRSVNMLNRKGATRVNASGIRGANFKKENGKWASVVRIQGKNKHLGYFETAERAGKVAAEYRKSIGCER